MSYVNSFVTEKECLAFCEFIKGLGMIIDGVWKPYNKNKNSISGRWVVGFH